jgi:hypothetical protein
MKRDYPDLNTQFLRAKLISPYFTFLLTYEPFLKDIQNIRKLYCSWKDDKIPLILLRQEYWNRNNESMEIVLGYEDNLRSVWEEFHKDVEKIAERYKIKQFPNLVKEYILNKRFGDLLFKYWMISWDWMFNLRVSRSIKKSEFIKLWDLMQEYNTKYPINRSLYSNFWDEVLEKYSYIETINRKYFADQKDLVLLITQELNGDLDQSIEWKIKWWDKSKKSRLKRIVTELFSLLDDLSNAGR